MSADISRSLSCCCAAERVVCNAWLALTAGIGALNGRKPLRTGFQLRPDPIEHDGPTCWCLGGGVENPWHVS